MWAGFEISWFRSLSSWAATTICYLSPLSSHYCTFSGNCHIEFTRLCTRQVSVHIHVWPWGNFLKSYYAQSVASTSCASDGSQSEPGDVSGESLYLKHGVYCTFPGSQVSFIRWLTQRVGHTLFPLFGIGTVATPPHADTLLRFSCNYRWGVSAASLNKSDNWSQKKKVSWITLNPHRRTVFKLKTSALRRLVYICSGL